MQFITALKADIDAFPKGFSGNKILKREDSVGGRMIVSPALPVANVSLSAKLILHEHELKVE